MEIVDLKYFNTKRTPQELFDEIPVIELMTKRFSQRITAVVCNYWKAVDKLKITESDDELERLAQLMFIQEELYEFRRKLRELEDKLIDVV